MKSQKVEGRIVEGSASYIIGLFVGKETQRAYESVISASSREIAIAATQQKYQGGTKN